VSPSFDLNPVERIGVGAVGEPGRRQFFLRVSGAGEEVVLACEKFHVQGLLTRIEELLESHGFGSETESRVRGVPAEPGPTLWRIGELGLGYHEGKAMFIIVARELIQSGEDEAAPDPAIARFWATAEQLRGFAGQAQGVLEGGRATCPRCGLALDPSGHPCPAANGLRPIF